MTGQQQTLEFPAASRASHSVQRLGSAFPPVLDACCGSRMFWFDKEDDRTLFVDIRRETHDMPPRENYPKGCKIVVNPDVLADFRSLPFPDDTFAHVVFDPPHFVRSGEKSGWLRNCYGWLDQEWKDTLRKGFAECFRVLRPDGTLIFKWTATDNPVSEILKLTPMKPLYGHKSGKQAQTHWVAFLKPNDKLTDPPPTTQT